MIARENLYRRFLDLARLAAASRHRLHAHRAEPFAYDRPFAHLRLGHVPRTTAHLEHRDHGHEHVELRDMRCAGDVGAFHRHVFQAPRAHFAARAQNFRRAFHQAVRDFRIELINFPLIRLHSADRERTRRVHESIFCGEFAHLRVAERLHGAPWRRLPFRYHAPILPRPLLCTPLPHLRHPGPPQHPAPLCVKRDKAEPQNVPNYANKNLPTIICVKGDIYMLVDVPFCADSRFSLRADSPAAR